MSEIDIQGDCPPRFAAVRDAFAANFTDAPEGLNEQAARFSVCLDGEVAIDLWAGHADAARTVPFGPDTLVPVFSTGKAVMALMIATCVERGLLAYDDTVASHWPAFGQAGKDAITVGQMMSHQSGLPGFAETVDPTIWFDRQAVLDRLCYTDALLLGLLLQPGQYSEPWEIEKYEGLRERSTGQRIDFAALRPGPIGFPRVHVFYLKVSETTEPLRVEVFSDLGEHQVAAAARRVYLYARLLPGYGFPVGLDVVDKYARVPAWLLAAYAKLIRYHLGVSLQSGEISDAEVRRLLVQAVYLTQRDWLFRPSAFLGRSRPSHDAEENHG